MHSSHRYDERRKKTVERLCQWIPHLFRVGKGHSCPRKYGPLVSCVGMSLVGARTPRVLHLHIQRTQEPGEGTL